MVAARSMGLTGVSVTKAPILSVAPTTVPVLTPPPPMQIVPDLVPVVATGPTANGRELFDPGCTAEIAAPNDKRGVEQSAGAEVAQQRCIGPVQARQQLGIVALRGRRVFPRQTCEVVVVRVPVAIADSYEMDAGLDQAASQQARLSKSMPAIGVAEPVAFRVKSKAFRATGEVSKLYACSWKALCDRTDSLSSMFC